ncbi:retinol dehydrogenase [Ascosphaera apis ARSEF 7405]|uniref:Retinol dehydrogenase n=1 Tax=Ascosphaera apis ARSEF 7405 TaxID=392613 RepID=A0A167XYJ7_9EURO|nr:retinol dehydrogenase [Ascosphaera apis ARSEF 7405]
MTVETKPSQGQNDATRDGKPPVESKEDGNVSSWAEVMGLQRFLVAMARYPLHNLGMAVSSFKQGIASLRGTQFKPATDIQDQSGKVILVTGGNAGLGYETIKELATHNPRRIYLAARSESKALEAITSIKLTLEQDVDIRYLSLDLSSFDSIRAAAKQFRNDCDRLDTLILNAGVMNAAAENITKEGYEPHIGVNYIGHWLLTDLLLPTLLKTAHESENPDVRVICLSSWAWMMSPIDLATLTSNEELLKQNSWARYGASKAANVVLACELAQQHPELTCVSLHPGIIPSNLYNRTLATNPLVSGFWPLAKKYCLPTEREGAFNQLLLAGGKKENLKNGGFYNPVGVLSRNWFAENDEVRKVMWKWAEQEVKKH